MKGALSRSTKGFSSDVELDYPIEKQQKSLVSIYMLIFLIWVQMSGLFQKPNITLSWRNLNAEVKGKTLLSNCSGYCKPGDMLAIMGASGAGKTTLLSIISQKADPQLTIKGQVLANNCPFNSSSFYNFGVYVYQDDTLHEMLTVRQTLHFTAILKYSNPQQAEKRVDELIRTFELQKCEQSFIGGKIKRGISGGQKKRVCIAVEMISRPSLLVLDEPTSGLDSHKAGTVMKVLRRLADQGCTVIFTIHQPSYLLYSMLSNLILLDKGATIYQGKAQNIGNYINQLGIAIPKHSTICDFFIWEISDFKAQKESYTSPLNSDNYTLRIEPIVTKQLQMLDSSTGYPELLPATTLLFMLATLLRREWLMFIRNPMKLVGSILNAIVGMIIVGVFFVNEIPSSDNLISEASVIDYKTMSYLFIGIQGVCFINITSQIMGGIFAVQLAFSVDREIYYKESSSKKYYPIAYFLSKTLIEFLSVAFHVLLFGVAVYWINGFQANFFKFLKYLLALLMVATCGNSLGFTISSIFKDPKSAAAMGPMITLPLMAFSGLYNKLNDIPAWISWLSYVSPFRYGLHMIVENQYGDMTLNLADSREYNYRVDLDMQLSYFENVLVTGGIALCFYLISFLTLKRLSTSISS